MPSICFNSVTNDFAQPRLHWVSSHVRFEGCCPNVLNPPPIGEGLAYFVLCDSPWTSVPWLQVAETQDHEPRSWRHHRGKARNVALAVLIRKDMKKPAVYDCIERASETPEVQSVDCQELDRDALVLRFGFRLTDSVWGGIDAPNLVTLVGEVQGVLPRAAATVQNRAAKLAVLLQSNDLTLRLADVPGRDAEIGGIESSHSSNVILADAPGNRSPLSFMAGITFDFFTALWYTCLSLRTAAEAFPSVLLGASYARRK